jgi:hypothetical protein
VRVHFEREFQDWRPKIVCLCGSTKFYEQFVEANYRETMAGNIILTVGFFMHRPDAAHGQSVGCTAEQKIRLDDLHKRKIDLCDEVLCLNVGNYIGESTLSELAYARTVGKVIRYLEKQPTELPQTSTGSAVTYCMNEINGKTCYAEIPAYGKRFCERCEKLREEMASGNS